MMIGNKWDELLADEWQKPYYQELRSFLKQEYSSGTVYPPAGDIYNALRLTDYDDVKVVILGQDPYHEPGQAHGLSFSVPVGAQEPPSLQNIFRELESDLGIAPPCRGGSGVPGADAGRPETAAGGGADMRTGWEASAPAPADAGSTPRGEPRIGAAEGASRAPGLLDPWARQGVLLLNTVLTVRAHQAGSHRGRGWEQFTDKIIQLLAERERAMVFVLWGAQAQAKRDIIRRAESVPRRHLIIEAPHPSPLSAYRGFFGGCYFSRCNYFLADNGMEPVIWKL